MKPVPNWGVVFRDTIAALSKALTDFTVNKPRLAPPTMTSDEILAEIDRLETILPLLKTWLAANPGALTAIDDFLMFLESEGFTWAAALRGAVDASPEAVAEAQSWEPTVRYLFGAFQPAAIGIPGGISGARGHI